MLNHSSLEIYFISNINFIDKILLILSATHTVTVLEINHVYNVGMDIKILYIDNVFKQMYTIFYISKHNHKILSVSCVVDLLHKGNNMAAYRS